MLVSLCPAVPSPPLWSPFSVKRARLNPGLSGRDVSVHGAGLWQTGVCGTSVRIEVQGLPAPLRRPAPPPGPCLQLAPRRSRCPTWNQAECSLPSGYLGVAPDVGVRPAVCIRAALSSRRGFRRGEGPVAGPSWPRGVTAEGRRPGASVGSGFCDLSLGPMHRWVLEARVSVQPRPVAGVGGLGGSPWRHSRPHLRCGPASHPCQGPAASPGHLTWPAFLRRE